MYINSYNYMIVLILIGALLISYSIGRQTATCPEPIIMYKYVPRNYEIDSNYPDMVSSQFKTMFSKPTPHIVELGNENLRKLPD